jgi:hypothetical protein
MAASPSQRTIKYLRDRGWPNVAVVEKWIPQARRRKDLFKFCDVLALHPTRGHLYVQATTGAHTRARLYKIREVASQEVEDVIVSGASVEIHGWRQLKVGNRKLWKPKIIEVRLGELYDMDKSDWDLVYDAIENVSRTIEPQIKQGIFTLRSVLHNYPPQIYITAEIDAGEGDNRALKFSKKEKVEISEIATTMVENAMAAYDWLALSKTYPPHDWALAYKLRPKSYSELAKELK